MNQVVLKILQGRAVAKTVIGRLDIILQLQISHAVYVPRIIKFG